ncbi:disease resistance protein L6-like [Cornus florida]|uniref:disease resistance protein L6-like n=1 Tax=Cornus florida TaxID=4283 RepID=UPI0028A1F302|nr:disease resistance protein L6-like [Cornus florida]
MGWKEAMTEVGALKGWEVKKVADGHQGELIKMIVQTVLLELKKKCMVITDNLVMMEDHLNEMTRLLNVGSNDTRIVGIHGMGGIGKTTIAKCTYNKLFQHFECCSFLADVREKVQQYNDLVGLQKQLLTDTLKCCSDITDINSGISAIKLRFQEKNALVVLDDVNEKSQFDWLVGNRDSFGPGSRIIVTTRNKDVLNTLEVDETYEPPLMNHEQSLQLLSIHAFQKKFPPIDYDSISKEIVLVSAVLPLALEVIGSFLWKKKEAIWTDTLKKLKNIPDDQVQKRLRISYDQLNHEQQQIFLDIACHFSGMDKTYAFYMWDDCGYYPEKEINAMCLMSLVKIINVNVLTMHDQLIDLGREIVRQEDFENPGMRSRLWDKEEALDVLEGEMLLGTEKKLVILDLSRSGITEKWKGWSQIKMANKLKVLDISWNHISKLPDEIWMLEILEVLRASSCNLKGNIPSCIERLSSLRKLNFGHNYIQSLPTSICKLSCLQTLDLGCGCNIQALPELPSSLEILHVTLYPKRNLHVKLANLVNLQDLRLSWCSMNLVEIPRYIEKRSKLQILEMENTNIRTLPKEIGALLSLLTILTIEECYKLTEIQGLGKLESLTHLTIRGCHKLKDVQGLENLKSLASLSITACKEIAEIDLLEPSAPLVSSLTILTIEECYKLTEIQGLGKLESLTHLTIRGCRKLKEVQGLGNLKSLASLSITACKEIAENLRHL